MIEVRQDTRWAAIGIEDVASTSIMLLSLHGTESMHGGSRHEVVVAGDGALPPPEELIGRAVDVRLGRGAAARHVNGFVRRAQRRDARRFDRFEVTLEVVSWLDLLDEASDHRCFQDAGAIDVVETIVAEHGLAELLDLSGARAGAGAIDAFVVQAGERTGAFLRRLLSEAGIAFVIDHEPGGHRVTGFTRAASRPFAEPRRFRLGTADPDGDVHAIDDLAVEATAGPQRVTVIGDHAHTGAAVRWATATESSDGGHGGPAWRLERTSAPQHEHRIAELERRADDARRRSPAARLVARGRTSVSGLVPGRRFELEGHPAPGTDGTWIVTSTTTSAAAESAAGPGGTIRVDFEAVPADDPAACRPPHVERPCVRGLHAAIVTGAGDRAIDLDDEGRATVQFRWDRHGPADDRSTCRIRVARPVAGHGSGFWAPPRVGDEVLVDFEHGDASRPVIVGSLHGPERGVPVDVASQSDASGLWSRSTDGSDWNALVFRDRPGEESVVLRAARDLEARVARRVLARVAEQVHCTIDDAVRVAVGGAIDARVAEAVRAAVGALDLAVDGAAALDVGGDAGVQAGGTLGLRGARIAIEASEQVSLSAGGSILVLDASGATLDGAMVRLASGGSASPPPSVRVTTPEAPDVPEDLDHPGGGRSPRLEAPSHRPVASRPGRAEAPRDD